MGRKKIGILLEEKGLVTEFQLVAALSHQRKWKIRLGKALLELGYIEERKLFEVIAEQWEMDLVDLNQVKIPEGVKRKISRDKGVALMAVPIKEENGDLVVAVCDPDRANLKEDLEKLTGMTVRLVIAMDSQLEEFSRTLPEKVPVGTVKPVKKAFRKNNSGDIELLEGARSKSETEELLGGKEMEKPAEEPIAIGDEPVALDDGLVQNPEAEITSKEALNVNLPNLGAAEQAQEPESKAVPVTEESGAKKEFAGEDTDELWESAETMPAVKERISSPDSSPAAPEDKEQTAPPAEPAKESDAMSDFFPGQMRDLEPPKEETGPKPEENVVELGMELGAPPREELKTEAPATKAEEKSEKEEPPFWGAESEQVPLLSPPDPGIVLTRETVSISEPEPKPAEPLSMEKQVKAMSVDSVRSEAAAAALEKKEILRMVSEIENKMRLLQEMVKELRERLKA